MSSFGRERTNADLLYPRPRLERRGDYPRAVIDRSRRTARTTVAATLLALALLAGACSSDGGRSDTADPSSGHRAARPERPTTAAAPTTTTAAPVLVPWTGPVEHLFFHTLVMRPDLAFTRGSEGQGFLDYFVTVGEFRKILDQLYANGWTLVDIHKAARGQVMVPAGRKPFVLSEDDVNFYDNTRGHGVGWRLVLDPAGDVKVEVRDDQGTRVTDDDIVPIVDQFVAAHPDFSAEGAKGVIALTGYEGLFGERVEPVDDPDSPGGGGPGHRHRRSAEGHRVDPGQPQLRPHRPEQGVDRRTCGRDAEKWLAEATPIIGPTDIYIYAYGAAPTPGSPKVDLLRDLGFTIQCDIDKVPRLVHVDGVDVMSRRHIDGIAFAQQGANLAGLFDVTTVEDAPPGCPADPSVGRLSLLGAAGPLGAELHGLGARGGGGLEGDADREDDHAGDAQQRRCRPGAGRARLRMKPGLVSTALIAPLAAAPLILSCRVPLRLGADELGRDRHERHHHHDQHRAHGQREGVLAPARHVDRGRRRGPCPRRSPSRGSSGGGGAPGSTAGRIRGGFGPATAKANTALHQ